MFPSPVGDFVFIQEKMFNTTITKVSVPCRGFCFYSHKGFERIMRESISFRPLSGILFLFPTCCILVFAMAAYMISGSKTIFFI